jgi:hypothetical protein
MPTLYGSQTITGTVTGQGQVASAGLLTTAGGLTVTGAIGVLAAPASISVAPLGTTGSSTYGYRVAAVNSTGTVSAPTVEVVTSTGNASLGATNYNLITFSPVAGATSYRVYGRFAGAEALIGFVTGDGRTANYTYADKDRNGGSGPINGQNTVPNASLTSGTTAWGTNALTMTRDQTHGQPVSGVSAALLTATATSAAWAQTSMVGGLPAQVVAASPGLAYTLSCYAYLGTATGVTLAGQWFNSSLGVLAAINSASVANASGWTRLTVTGTAPANTAYVNVYLGLTVNATGQTAWIAAPQIDLGSSALPFVTELPVAAAANLTEWQSGGTVLSHVDSNGYIWEGSARVYSLNNPPPSSSSTYASAVKFRNG